MNPDQSGTAPARPVPDPRHSRPYLPGALKDTTARRAFLLSRRIGDGAGLLPRLLSAAGHDLVFGTVPLGPGDLYARDTNEQARALSRQILGKVPAWVVLEQGQEGGLHLHILAAASGCPTWPPGSVVKAVHDAVGLVRYLSKPADGRACRAKDPRTGCYAQPSRFSVEAALAAFQAAKRAARAEGRRLPRLSWTVNVPRLKADPLDLPDAAPVLPLDHPADALPAGANIRSTSNALAFCRRALGAVRRQALALAAAPVGPGVLWPPCGPPWLWHLAGVPRDVCAGPAA